MRGFTLVEWLFLVTILACTAGALSVLGCGAEGEPPFLKLSPRERARNKVQCLNNLRNIGGMLVSSLRIRKGPDNSGAPFLLQIAPKIKDSQLKVFVCPGERPVEGRPELDSREFIALYRENTDLGKLDEATLRKMCSYAGPNWRDYPNEPASKMTRVWGCDACMGNVPHHDGIALLYDDGSARFVEMAKLGEEKDLVIHVGPDYPDRRLKKLCFMPAQR